MTLLTRVMRCLQREMEREGKGRQYQTLKETIGGSEDRSYSDLAQELGLTVPAARMAASRLRSRYRELLREEIAQTVAADEDIAAEVQALFAALAT